MSKTEAQSAPRDCFILATDEEMDEVYAGTSMSEYKHLVHEMYFLRPAEREATKLDKQSCDICLEAFGPRESFSLSKKNSERKSERPVILPCGHIFGKDCISHWIANHPDYIDGEPQPEVHRAIGPNHVDDLAPTPEVLLRTKTFTCPICRGSHTVPTSEEQAPAIEARLRFWDYAYEKLGIVRSQREEVSRLDLWQFVERMSLKPKEAVCEEQARSYDLRAQESAMQFASRRATRDLTPIQKHLCRALFKFAFSERTEFWKCSILNHSRTRTL